MQQSTARYAAGLELSGEGAGLPQVPSGSVSAEGAASDRPQHLGPLLSAHVLELETASQPRSV